MKHFAPHYYKKFRCIADKCKDNCCIGWEIDIDRDTMIKYRSMGGELGEKLKLNITVSEDGSDCFKLTEQQRCPFLDKNNLCELILHGGDDMLCEICRLHPRFINYLPDRCEIGLGLCCEAAAEIILNDTEPFSLEATDSDNEKCREYNTSSDFIFSTRALLITETERFSPIDYKTGMLLGYGSCLEETIDSCDLFRLRDTIPHNQHHPYMNHKENIELILSLEPLNDEWKRVCQKLTQCDMHDIRYDKEDELYYSNLLKYYIYRYYADYAEDYDVYSPAALAVFSADAVAYIKKSTGMSFIESACLWSKEIDYSSENISIICDYLYDIRG